MRSARLVGILGNWLQDPELLSPYIFQPNYYNRCLSFCSKPFILKWDGDMIAMELLRSSLEEWRRSDKPIMIFNGVNVYPDFRHTVAAKSSDRERLLASLSVPALPRWVTSLSHDYAETGLFPKFLAKYESTMGWT